MAASQHSDPHSFFHIDAQTFLGAAIAIAGGAAVASTAFTFSWSEQIQQDIFASPDHTESGHAETDNHTALVLTAFIITNAIALPINAIIAVLDGETIVPTQIILGLLTGIFVQGAGAILFRLANILTQSLGINAVYYATPCLTVVWLLILRHPIPNLPYLAAGTIAIIAANLILSLRPIRTPPHDSLSRSAP